MGAIISRWKSKKSTEEILEELNKKIEALEQFKKQNQELQRRYIGALIVYSTVVYIMAALVFYFYYLPTTWMDRLVYSSPLLLFPVLVWLMKKVLHWYFVKRISQNDFALEDCKDRKKQILEEVMEKETYKKAKEILEKYDPERFKELEKPKENTPVQLSHGQELHQRQSAAKNQGVPVATPAHRNQAQVAATPHLPRPTPGVGRGTFSVPPNSQQRPGYGPSGPPMPRQILPRDRSALDRVVEYLVGDGPQNRYALICRTCHSHNGMALREEFEYISFRCCYCFALSEARKKRPAAPKLETPPTVRRKIASEENQNVENSELMTDDDDDSAQDNITETVGVNQEQGIANSKDKKDN